MKKNEEYKLNLPKVLFDENGFYYRNDIGKFVRRRNKVLLEVDFDNEVKERKNFENLKQELDLPDYFVRIEVLNSFRNNYTIWLTQINGSDKYIKLLYEKYEEEIKYLKEQYRETTNNKKKTNIMQEIKNIRLAIDFLKEIGGLYKNNTLDNFPFVSGTKEQMKLIKNFKYKKSFFNEPKVIKVLENNLKKILKENRGKNNEIENLGIEFAKDSIKKLKKGEDAKEFLDGYLFEQLILLYNNKLIDNDYQYGSGWLKNTDIYKIIPDFINILNKYRKNLFKEQDTEIALLINKFKKVYNNYLLQTKQKVKYEIKELNSNNLKLFNFLLD